MKKTLALTAIAMLVSGPVVAKTWVLTSAESGMDKGNWQITSDQLKIKDHNFSIEQKVLHGGKQEGSKILVIHSKDGLTITLSPTRGMNLLKIEGFGSRMGWDSPVKEVVNPAFINLESRNGLGWLEGFNEMMVRCGYEWTGHPGEVDGKLLSLHGRAGNTPASKVVVSIDETAPYAIHVKGLVKENTFKLSALETWTQLTVVPGEKSVKIHDELTNDSDYDREYQIIYHSNFGSPILEEGAKFVAPVKEISPFNNYAKKGLKDWQTYLAPTRNFDEMVFNLVPYADKDGKTTTMLHNKAANKGIAVSYDTKQLPVLTLWKNTDTLKQGYVTGIEPGTSYAYPRQFEKEQGRVKTLSPSARQAFDLEYRVMTTADEVTTVQKEINTIAAGQTTKLINKPMRKE